MKIRLWTALILVALLLGACSPQATPTASPQTSVETPGADQGGYLVAAAPFESAGPETGYPAGSSMAGFEIVVNDETRAVDLDFLAGLPQNSVSVDGSALQGPNVLETLTQQRVVDFTEVVVSGPNGSLTLNKDQLEGYIFALSADGIILTRPDASADQIVRGVQRVEVR